MTKPIEFRWEQDLNEKLNYIIQAGFEIADKETEDILKQFIRDLLEDQYQKGLEMGMIKELK